MTTDLEKQFFDTFGIEPRLDCKRCGAKNFALGQCAEVNCEKTYPQITDSILLELITFIGKKGFGFLYCENTFSTGFGNRKDLITVQAENFKEGILTLAIQKKTVLRIKKDVQALFKE